MKIPHVEFLPKLFLRIISKIDDRELANLVGGRLT